MTRTLTLFSMVSLCSYSVGAEEPDTEKTQSRVATQPDNDADEDSNQKKLLQEMQWMAEQIRIVERDDKRAEVPMIPRPLFRYNSPSRGYDDGTIWGWGEGRPLAMMELWTRDARREKSEMGSRHCVDLDENG